MTEDQKNEINEVCKSIYKAEIEFRLSAVLSDDNKAYISNFLLREAKSPWHIQTIRIVNGSGWRSVFDKAFVDIFTEKDEFARPFESNVPQTYKLFVDTCEKFGVEELSTSDDFDVRAWYDVELAPMIIDCFDLARL